MMRKLWIASVLVLAACQGSPDESEPEGSAETVAEAEQPIYNGTPVTAASSPETSGVVSVWGANAAICTGTLLTNDWVLTAAHCNLASLQNAPSVEVGNYIDGAQDVLYPADFVVNHPSLDAALLHLKRSIPVNGKVTDHKTGFYTGDTGNGTGSYDAPSSDGKLQGKTFNFLGYGNLNDQGGRGVFRQAYLTANGAYGPHTFSTAANALGQATAPADSGGGLFLDRYMNGTLNRVIMGITKSGDQQQSHFSRAENIREWALSYVYGRPVELPNVWFVWDAKNPNTNVSDWAHQIMWSKPLANGFDNLADWQDPCFGMPYTWGATFDLERSVSGFAFDWIDITTKDPNNPQSTITTRLSGKSTISSITGLGGMTVRVHTDGSVQSPGLLALPVMCGGEARVQFPRPWTDPLPKSTVNQSYQWNPCPGGESYTWNAEYDFTNGDTGRIGTTYGITGQGTTSGRERGSIYVGINTGAGGTSRGFKSLTATCDMAIQCHGPKCFTTPSQLPNGSGVGQQRDAFVYWDPCNGRPFYWNITFDMEQGFDFIKVRNGAQVVASFTGKSPTLQGQVPPPPSYASGPLTIQVTTDHSVSSRGIQDLSATCVDW